MNQKTMSQTEQPAPENNDQGLAKALDNARSVLVEGEQILHWTIQRRIAALLHRRVLVVATNKRLVVINRGLFAGFSMEDVRWQDVLNVGIDVGIFCASLTVEVADATNLTLAQDADGQSATARLGGLRKDETAAIYRYAQNIEQSWREKRRVREIEEMRARSGGVQIGTQTSNAGGKSTLERLEQAKQMLEKGLISDSEYEALKAKIVSEI